MIITIQKSTRGYVVTMIDKTEFVNARLQEMTSMAGEFSEEYFKKYGIRPTIKILSIQHKINAKTKRKNRANRK